MGSSYGWGFKDHGRVRSQGLCVYVCVCLRKYVCICVELRIFGKERDAVLGVPSGTHTHDHQRSLKLRILWYSEVKCRRVMNCAALIPGLNDAGADADAAGDVAHAPPRGPPAMNHSPPPPLLCNGIRQEVSIQIPDLQGSKSNDGGRLDHC